MRWLKVAQLKALVKRPDLVEAWDITATDPLFLLELKSLRNTVAVPRHWNQKCNIYLI
jgi:splicing factor 3B subunit 2